jgi:hypothetical protein
VLVTEVADGLAHGHAAHQHPENDGGCVLRLPGGEGVAVGDLVAGTVVATVGVDLVAEFGSVVDSAAVDPAVVDPAAVDPAVVDPAAVDHAAVDSA